MLPKLGYVSVLYFFFCFFLVLWLLFGSWCRRVGRVWRRTASSNPFTGLWCRHCSGLWELGGSIGTERCDPLGLKTWRRWSSRFSCRCSATVSLDLDLSISMSRSRSPWVKFRGRRADMSLRRRQSSLHQQRDSMQRRKWSLRQRHRSRQVR